MFADNVVVTTHDLIAEDVYRVEAYEENGRMFEIANVLAADAEKNVAILAGKGGIVTYISVEDILDKRRGLNDFWCGKDRSNKSYILIVIFPNSEAETRVKLVKQLAILNPQISQDK